VRIVVELGQLLAGAVVHDHDLEKPLREGLMFQSRKTTLQALSVVEHGDDDGHNRAALTFNRS
jgi:hypothetical protein